MAEEEKNPRNNPILSGESDGANLVSNLYMGTAEKTEQVSSYVEDTFYRPFNPDDLYQKTGDHSIYEEMLQDDQVNVCLQLKKDLIIGGGWDIVTEQDGDMEIADSVYSSLEEDPDCALDDYLDTYIENANAYGFGLAEKLFQRKKDSMLTLKSLKTRHPDSWLIHTDDAGNVKHYEQRQAKSSIEISPNAIMRYTPNESTVGPYGVSDLRKVYNAWFTKRHITRFYSIFLEGAAKPIPVARYDKNLPNSKVTALHNIIKNFQAKTALTIPKDIEVEFLEAQSNGESFVKGINLFNMFIGRGLFVPDLLGFTGEGSATGGSQALGREQVDMFLKHIGKRRRSIERLINRHIVLPIITHNFGFMEQYPKFQFRPITEEDTKEYAKIFIEAVRGKFYNPTEEEINHLRGLIKFPEGDVDLIPSGSAGGFNPPNPDSSGGGGVGVRGGNIIGRNKDGSPIYGDPSDKENISDDTVDDKKEFALNQRSAFPEANLKQKDIGSTTNFVALEGQLNATEAEIISLATPIIDDIFEDLFKQLEKSKAIEKIKPERLNKLKLKNLGKLQNILKASFRDAWRKHGNMAMAEIIKTEFRAPIPSDEFLRVLEEESFQYVGDWEYEITKGARTAMQEAIRDGKPLSSVIDLMETEAKRSAIVSLERYSRTKNTEVMNNARMAMFDESRVVDRVQYKAILDNRTTNICAGLHDKIFEKGQEPRPPMHFNCRSVIVPITVFQEGDVDKFAGGEVTVRDPKTRKKVTKKIPKKPIDAFIEENKGKGFSRR